jgi:hypothetical protein
MELISLQCNEAQQTIDRPYLMVNGHIAWGPTRMRTGNIRSIQRRVAFDHDVTVELRESENNRRVPHRKDDHIGCLRLDEPTVRFLVRSERGGNLVRIFNRDGGIVGDATYTLTYELYNGLNTTGDMYAS